MTPANKVPVIVKYKCLLDLQFFDSIYHSNRNTNIMK